MPVVLSTLDELQDDATLTTLAIINSTVSRTPIEAWKATASPDQASMWGKLNVSVIRTAMDLKLQQTCMVCCLLLLLALKTLKMSPTKPESNIWYIACRPQVASVGESY